MLLAQGVEAGWFWFAMLFPFRSSTHCPDEPKIGNVLVVAMVLREGVGITISSKSRERLLDKMRRTVQRMGQGRLMTILTQQDEETKQELEHSAPRNVAPTWSWTHRTFGYVAPTKWGWTRRRTFG